MIAFMTLFIMACSSSLYSISGTVSGDADAIGNGVTINLTGAATASVTTDTNGNYSFTGLADGTYTLTPSSTGYIFNPVSTVVVVSQGAVTNINFVATSTGGASTYSISGTVTGAVQAGVSITLGDYTTGTAVTGASGNYSFSNLANGGTYIVTPTLPGYTFNPVSMVVLINGANATTNFVATAASGSTYSISGTVTGTVQAGVLITLSSSTTGTTITDASGNYSFSNLASGDTYTYIVTPSLAGYTFTPDNSGNVILNANAVYNFTSFVL
jgi:hypothetical protein